MTAPSAQVDNLGPHLEKLSLGPKSTIMAEIPNSPSWVDKRKKLRRQMKGMIGNLEKECYRLIFDIFPEKIQLLDNMYKTQKEFNLKREEMSPPLPSFSELAGLNDEDRQKKASTITVPANAVMNKLVGILQKEILEMSEMINSLSIWVRLNVPRMADGNNFGVEVQEEISKVLESTEEAGYEVLDSFASYNQARAGLVAKLLKNPNIVDYQVALKELDEKTYIKTSLLACELRNDYITLYDMLAKNLETLVTPRGGEDEKLARMY